MFLINMGFINNIGGVEWVIIIAIVLLISGGGIVRGIAKRAGEATKEMKKAKKDFEEAAKEKPENEPNS